MEDFYKVPTDNLKKLHGSMTERLGFNVPYEQFEKDMQDDRKLNALHQSLKTKGAELPDFDQFKSDMFGTEPKYRQLNESIDKQQNQVVSDQIADPTQEKSATEQETGFWHTAVGDAMQRFGAGTMSFLGNTAGFTNMPMTAFFNAQAKKEGLSDEERKVFADAVLQVMPTNAVAGTIKKKALDEAERLRSVSDRYAGKDFVDLYKEGDYLGMVGEVLLSGAESLPNMIMAMTPAGLPLIAMSSASGKYDELSDPKLAPVFSEKEMQDYLSTKNMGEFAKITNAILTGGVEAGTELLGSKEIGRWIKTLAQHGGKEVAEETVKGAYRKFMDKMFKKYGLLMSPISEGNEELVNSVVGGWVDRWTGANTDLDAGEEIKKGLKSWVYGAGGGAYGSMAGGAVMGANRLINGKEQEQTPTDPEQPADQVQPPAPDPRTVAQQTAEQFFTDHADINSGTLRQVSLVTPESEPNIPLFVKAEQQDELGNHTFLVVDEKGNERLVDKRDLAGDPTDVSKDDFINSQMSAYDELTAGQELMKQNQINYDGRTYLLTGEQTREGYVALDMETNEPTYIPSKEVRKYKSDPSAVEIITRVFGKNTYRAMKTTSGNIALIDYMTQEQVSQLEQDVQQTTQGRMQVVTQEKPSDDPSLPKVYGVKLVPSQNTGGSGVSVNNGTTTPSSQTTEQSPVVEQEKKPSYPLTKDGKPDLKQMNEEQMFQFNMENFGEETAIEDLNGDIALLQEKIAKAQAKLQKSDTVTKIETRIQIKEMQEKLTRLQNLLPKSAETVNNSETNAENVAENDNNNLTQNENVPENSAVLPDNQDVQNQDVEESSQILQESENNLTDSSQNSEPTQEAGQQKKKENPSRSRQTLQDNLGKEVVYRGKKGILEKDDMGFYVVNTGSQIIELSKDGNSTLKDHGIHWAVGRGRINQIANQESDQVDSDLVEAGVDPLEIATIENILENDMPVELAEILTSETTTPEMLTPEKVGIINQWIDQVTDRIIKAFPNSDYAFAQIETLDNLKTLINNGQANQSGSTTAQAESTGKPKKKSRKQVASEPSTPVSTTQTQDNGQVQTEDQATEEVNPPTGEQPVADTAQGTTEGSVSSDLPSGETATESPVQETPATEQQPTETKKASSPKTKMLNDRKKAIQKIVDTLAKGADNAYKSVVVATKADLPEHIRKKLGKDRADAVFDERTSTVYFVADTIALKDITRKWVHEQAIHRGIRVLFQDPTMLNNALRAVFNKVGLEEISKRVPAWYVERHAKKRMSNEELAEEYLAHLAERIISKNDLNPNEKAIWDKFAEWFKKAINHMFSNTLDQNGIDVEVEQLIRASTRALYEKTALPDDAPIDERTKKDYRNVAGILPSMRFSYHERDIELRKIALYLKKTLGLTDKKATKQMEEYFEKMSEQYKSYIKQVEASKSNYPKMGTASLPKNTDPTYKLTVDLVGACVRMLRAMAVHKQVRKGEVKLNAYQMRALEVELNKAGFDLTCAYCYAFTHRATAIEKMEAMRDAIRLGEIPQEVFDNLDKAQRKFDKNPNSEDNQKELKKTKERLDLWKNAVKEAEKNPKWYDEFSALPDMLAIKTPSDAETIQDLSKDVVRFMEKYPAIYDLKQKVADGGNMKMPTSTLAIAGQIVNISDDMAKDLAKWGGLRWQSSIDFIPMMTYDYIQGLIEMNIRGLAGHSYTKEIDFAMLIAKTGFKMNLSCAPLVRNGKVVWETDKDGNRRPVLDPSIGSMRWEEVEKAMEADPDHVGVMMLGVNDEILDWATNEGSKYAPYVIPYHSSGMPAKVSEIFTNTKGNQNALIGATDYKDSHEEIVEYDSLDKIPEKYRKIGIEIINKHGDPTGKFMVDYSRISEVHPELQPLQDEYIKQQKEYRSIGGVKKNATLTGINIPTGFIIDQTKGESDEVATQKYFDYIDALGGTVLPLFESYRQRFKAQTGKRYGSKYWTLKKHYARTDTPLLPPDPNKVDFDLAKRLDEEWAQSPMAQEIAEGKSSMMDAFKNRILTDREIKLIKKAVKRIMKVESENKDPMREVVSDISALVQDTEIESQEIEIEDDTKPIRMSIIGEDGASKLGVIIDNLSTAKEMESQGIEPKKIFVATGWEKFRDGWKYDLPDAEIMNDPKYNALGFPMLKRMIELGDDNLKVGLKAILSGNGASMLFKAYPKLKDASVRIEKTDASTVGYFSESKNEIVLGKEYHRDLLKNRTENDVIHAIRSTIIHEIQHFIQKEEGFARGGNLEMAKRIAVTKANEKANENPEYKRLKDEYDQIIRKAMLFRHVKDLYKEYSRKAQEVKEKADWILQEASRELFGTTNMTTLGKGVYTRLAGETESRNAETRLLMDQVGRRFWMISETEDVNEEQKIYIHNKIDLFDQQGTPYKSDRTIPVSELLNDLREMRQEKSGNIRMSVSTIEVDGVKRPTTNSNGKPIHPTEEGVKNFWKWFGDSKVVDEQGRPLVVYHGSTEGVNRFSNERLIFTTDNKKVADYFGTRGEYYVSMKNPYIIEDGGHNWSRLDEWTASKMIGEEAYLKLLNYEYGENFKSMDEYFDFAKKGGALGLSIDVISNYVKKNLQNDGVIAYNIEETTEYVPSNDYVVFEPNQIKSAVGNNGGFSSENNDIRFSASNRQKPLTKVLEEARDNSQNRTRGSRSLRQVLEGMRELYQDMNLPIRRLEEEIKKLGGKITDKTKPYRDMFNSFGRAEQMLKSFTENKMKPILKAINDIQKEGVHRGVIIPYVMAKHAIERNEYMRNKEWNEWFEDHKNDYVEWSDKNPDATRAMHDKMFDKFEQEKQDKWEELLRKDYAGVRDFSNDNWEFPDELAQKIVADFEATVPKKLVSNLHKAIRSATEEIVGIWKDGRSISEEQADEMLNRYQYFVPLQGWRHAEAKEAVYAKKGGFGSSLRSAKGRSSMADNPLIYLQKTAFLAIAEQTDNEVKTSFLNLVKENYGDQFSKMYKIKKAYYVKTLMDDGSEGWVLYRDAEGELARPPEEMFDRGEAKAQLYNQHMKLRTLNESQQHEVIVHTKNGDVAVVLSTPYLDVAQAMNRTNFMYLSLLGAVKDAREWNNLAIRNLGEVNNFIKRTLTSWDVTFPLRNIFRDLPEASLSTYIQGGSGLDVMSKSPKAMRIITADMMGKLDKNSADYKLLQEFKLSGATTGYTHLKSPEEIEKDIEREIRLMEKKGNVNDYLNYALHKTFGGIEAWNEIFENTTRFAVYMSARQSGKTIGDSAQLAKEASVNFNRKGKMTKALDALWAFFNVGIQSLQKNTSLAKNYPKRFAIVATSFMTYGFLEAFMMDALTGDDDDDDYYNINSYVRQNYMVLPWLSKGGYLRVPLPQFWRGFKALGTLAHDVYKGKADATQAVTQGFGNFTASLLPIDVMGFFNDGEFTVAPLVPTVFRPMDEIRRNRNFMNQTIYKEPFTKDMEAKIASSSLGKNNVDPAIKFFTDVLASWGGKEEGNDSKFYREGGESKRIPWAMDLNPSKVQHFVGGYLGGTYKFASNLITSIEQAVNPEKEFDINNAPFIDVFIRKTPEAKWRIISQYYDLRKDDGYQSFDILSKTYKGKTDEQSRAKYEELMSDMYLQKYKFIMDSYDDRLTKAMKNIDMKTAEGSEEVLGYMKDAIKEINDLKTEYKK